MYILANRRAPQSDSSEVHRRDGGFTVFVSSDPEPTLTLAPNSEVTTIDPEGVSMDRARVLTAVFGSIGVFVLLSIVLYLLFEKRIKRELGRRGLAIHVERIVSTDKVPDIEAAEFPQRASQMTLVSPYVTLKTDADAAPTRDPPTSPTRDPPTSPPTSVITHSRRKPVPPYIGPGSPRSPPPRTSSVGALTDSTPASPSSAPSASGSPPPPTPPTKAYIPIVAPRIRTKRYQTPPMTSATGSYSRSEGPTRPPGLQASTSMTVVLSEEPEQIEEAAVVPVTLPARGSRPRSRTRVLTDDSSTPFLTASPPPLDDYSFNGSIADEKYVELTRQSLPPFQSRPPSQFPRPLSQSQVQPPYQFLSHAPPQSVGPSSSRSRTRSRARSRAQSSFRSVASKRMTPGTPPPPYPLFNFANFHHIMLQAARVELDPQSPNHGHER